MSISSESEYLARYGRLETTPNFTPKSPVVNKIKETIKIIRTIKISKYLSFATIAKGGISSSFRLNSLDDCLILYNLYYTSVKPRYI